MQEAMRQITYGDGRVSGVCRAAALAFLWEKGKDGRLEQLGKDTYLGLNECCPRTTARARELADSGVAAAVLESRDNRNKDPILRHLIELARTPYLLWLDDDSHFTDDHWPQAFAGAVASEHPFDAAGQHARWGPPPRPRPRLCQVHPRAPVVAHRQALRRRAPRVGPLRRRRNVHHPHPLCPAP
jgi:hypothetical protein